MSQPKSPKQTILIVLLTLATSCQALSSSFLSNRRTMVLSTISGSSLLIPTAADAMSGPPTYSSQPIQGRGGSQTRIEGIGSGLDLTTSTVPSNTDVIYPASSLGSWTCQRIITSVEGDAGQAEVAWRCLGGPSAGGDWKGVEKYMVELVLPPKQSIENTYTFDGKMFDGVVLNRGLELEARSKDRKASWEVTNPTHYSYEQGGRLTELDIVQRKIDLPSEQGFGYNEIVRITTAAGGIFGEGNKVQRAIRVQRRYRRALDGDGNRTIEGLELVKTYRVLDGVAGVEMPTSTTKSMIRFSQL